MNRDYGGLDALGSKHVAPWQKPDWWTGGRWIVSLESGVDLFFTREKKAWWFFMRERGVTASTKSVI